MKKNFKEILDMPEFNLYMDPSDISIFFIGKNKTKYEEIRNNIHQRQSNAIMNGITDESDKSLDELAEIHNGLKEQFEKKKNDLLSQLDRSNLSLAERRTLLNEIKKAKLELKALYDKMMDAKAEFLYKSLRTSNSDALVTHMMGKSTKDVISENPNDFSLDRYLLFQGLLAKEYLKWITDVESENHSGYDEFCFDNGIIISIDGNQIGINIDAEKLDFYTLDDIKTRLINTILKSNQLLQERNKNRNKPISIDGICALRGRSKRNIRIKGNSIDFSNYIKSSNFISLLDPLKIKGFLDEGLFKKNDFIRLLKKNELSEEMVTTLLSNNIFSSDEVCRSYRASSLKDVLKKRNFKFEAAFMLYSADKLNVDDFEEIFGNRDDIKMPDSDFFGGISAEFYDNYYKNINKIAELITHHILDFTASMDFLDSLENALCISPKEKTKLIKIMNDFKPDELENVTQNEMKVSGEGKGIISHVRGLTIDPELRKAYLKSIGEVKKVKIKGNSLLKDDSSLSNKKNSLDGYQIVVLPDKDVALLEKFYETERDKDDNVVFKRDSEGNKIPAVENATYIMPIGMAKEFATKKNKQELIRSRFVKRVSHTANWVKNIETKIINLNEELYKKGKKEKKEKEEDEEGIKIEFDQTNTEYWSKRIAENYRLLRANR